MSAEVQRVIALSIVALAAFGLLLRLRPRRKPPGCGGDCSCSGKKLRR